MPEKAEFRPGYIEKRYESSTCTRPRLLARPFLIAIRLAWDRKFNQVKSVENVALDSKADMADCSANGRL